MSSERKDDKIGSHKEILQNSSYNKTKQSYTDYLKDKSIVKKIELENKVALEGVYYPYKQQILYDTITKEAIHLVSGLRE